MTATTIEIDEDVMAKKKAVSPPPPEPDEDRVTILNLKGSVADRDYLRSVVKKTGVPAATIARRSMAAWVRQTYGIEPPASWLGG